MAHTLTHMQILTECAKVHLTQEQSKEAKAQIMNDIQQCVVVWLERHTGMVEPDHIGGFVFPQTPTHEAVVVMRVFERSDKQRAESAQKAKPKNVLVTDMALKFISKRILEMFQSHSHKSVAWTWPVVESYVEQFHAEFLSLKESSEPKPKDEPIARVRICRQIPRGSTTIGLNELSKSQHEMVFVVVTFPIPDPLLDRMYQLLLDHGDAKQVLKQMKHENMKFRESIERNVLAQHQRQTQSPTAAVVARVADTAPPTPPPQPIRYNESIAVRAKQATRSVQPSAPSRPPTTETALPEITEPVEVKFQMTTKPAYTAVRVTMSNYLGTLRTKHRNSDVAFESMLTIPVTKSIQSHPFYLYLHKELQQCREQTYRQSNPDAALTRTSIQVRTSKAGSKKRKSPDR